VIYVYAITDAVEIDEGLTGLHDAPTEALEREGIAGIFSRHDQLELSSSDPELLWAHERVVDRLMNDGAVLPLRFGTILSGPEALRAVLDEDQVRFRVLLSRVRGCVELAVRVGLAPAEPVAVSGGADYIRGRLAARQHEEDAADRVLAPLRSLARATARRPVQAGSTTVSESYLVSRPTVELFASEVRALQARNPGLSISCTGPWGPYSFVDRGEK
jgi:Gas vesicle synthesis protein GvpL/GvpF